MNSLVFAFKPRLVVGVTLNNICTFNAHLMDIKGAFSGISVLIRLINDHPCRRKCVEEALTCQTASPPWLCLPVASWEWNFRGGRLKSQLSLAQPFIAQTTQYSSCLRQNGCGKSCATARICSDGSNLSSPPPDSINYFLTSPQPKWTLLSPLVTLITFQRIHLLSVLLIDDGCPYSTSTSCRNTAWKWK